MAKKPAARFKDAGAMLAALEAVVAKLPAAALSAGRAESRKESSPRPRWRGAIIPLMVAVGIAAAATVLRRERAKPVETAAKPAQTATRPTQPAARSVETAAKPAPPAPVPTRAVPPPMPAPEPTPPPTAAPPPAPAVAAAEPTPTKPDPPPPPPAEERPPAPVPAPERPAPKEVQAQPAIEARSGTGARDPWREPVPHALRSIRERMDRGVHMSQKSLRPAYDYAHKNPADPRPWLLLGHAYAELDWLSDAVERYVRAHQVDAASRGDPQMLPDLIKAAAHPAAGRAGARAIDDIYGAEAIPALDRAIERRATDREAVARLTRLRASLRH